MGSASLTLGGKQVLDNDTGLPVKIKFKGDTPNEEQLEKLKVLKNEIQNDTEQPVSGAGSFVDNQLGMLFSMPQMGGSRIAYQTGKDIISNIGSFGFDIAAFFTDDEEKQESYEETAQNIREFLPDVRDLPAGNNQTIGQANPTRQNIEDVISTGGQYVAPALGVTKITNLSKLPNFLKYPTNLLGITASDVAVTDPDDAKTIADTFGIESSPTKIDEDDTALEKRLKVGAETIPAVLGIDAVVKGIKPLIPQSIKESAMSPFSTETQKDLLAKSMAKSIYETDPIKYPAGQFSKETKLPDDVTNQLIKNIDEAVELGSSVGVQPTLGTSSKNVGLIAMERGISTAKNTSSAMTNRKITNIANMTNALEETLKTQQKGTTEFLQTSASKLKESENLKNKLLINIDEAVEETDNLISSFNKYATKNPSVLSSNIDTALKNDLKQVVSNKNKLFDAIDPNGTVILDRKILSNALKNATMSRTPKLTSPLLNRITKSVLNDKKTGAIYIHLESYLVTKQKHL